MNTDKIRELININLALYAPPTKHISELYKLIEQLCDVLDDNNKKIKYYEREIPFRSFDKR